MRARAGMAKFEFRGAQGTPFGIRQRSARMLRSDQRDCRLLRGGKSRHWSWLQHNSRNHSHETPFEPSKRRRLQATGKPDTMQTLGANQAAVLLVGAASALGGSVAVGRSGRRSESEVGRLVHWLYRMAMSGSMADWVLRAARAISRPEPMISDPPASMGRPGLSCQTT